MRTSPISKREAIALGGDIRTKSLTFLTPDEQKRVVKFMQEAYIDYGVQHSRFEASSKKAESKGSAIPSVSR